MMLLAAVPLAAPVAAASARGTYVVGTYDGSALRLYVDGAAVATVPERESPERPATPLEIGGYLGAAIWSGTIGEVAIYDRALPAGAVAARYRLGTAGGRSYRAAVLHTRGLVGYWPLHDAGPRAVDLTGADDGVYSGPVSHGQPGLIAGTGASSAGFAGTAGHVDIPASPALALGRTFTLEAWVTVGSSGNRVILGKAGAYFLKTDQSGRWGVGFVAGGAFRSAYSPAGARGAPGPPHRPVPGGPPKAVTALKVFWLAVLVALFVAVWATRRWWPERSGRPPDGATGSAAAGSATAAGRLPLIDSLRAIAALSVLLFHAGGFSGLTTSHPLGRYAERLDVGVTIFFLISGLLLYRPFVLARLRGRRAPATGAYAWRRLLRIVPAYWLALVVTALTVGTVRYAPSVFSAAGIPRYFLFGQDYFRDSVIGGLGQAWTLSIEVAFYAFLPAYAWLQRATSSRDRVGVMRAEIAGLIALVVVSEVWKWVEISGETRVAVTPWLDTLPAYLDHFALGMGLAVLSAWIQVRGRSPRWVASFDRAPTAAWAFAAVMFVIAAGAVIPPARFASWSPAVYLGRQWLYGLVALGLLLPAVIGDQRVGLARRILRNRVLAWLGLISYGIYLWHVTVLEELVKLGFRTSALHDVIHPWFAWPAALLIGSVVVAALSYYGLELPALSLKRFVGRPVNKATAPAGGAAPAAPGVPAPRSRP
jgi:peptidoglycan/LPS O-acetylase OafA/YrhL